VKNIIICDIDGTIADITHRLHFIEGETKDWDGFFKACVNDAPYVDIIEILNGLHQDSADIIYITGRSDIVRWETGFWLDKFDAPVGGIRMRKAGDFRPDHEIKAEMLQGLTPDDVWFILEDRDQVVKMWRENGFRVLQVADGAF
jgi:hypothetical protein